MFNFYNFIYFSNPVFSPNTLLFPHDVIIFFFFWNLFNNFKRTHFIISFRLFCPTRDLGGNLACAGGSARTRASPPILWHWIPGLVLGACWGVPSPAPSSVTRQLSAPQSALQALASDGPAFPSPLLLPRVTPLHFQYVAFYSRSVCSVASPGSQIFKREKIFNLSFICTL